MNTLITQCNGFAPLWAENLIRALWQGSLFLLLVWGICRFRQISARIRCVLWWLVCAKLVIGLFPVMPVLLPVLSPAAITNHRSESTLPNLPSLSGFPVINSGFETSQSAPLSEISPLPRVPMAAPKYLVPGSASIHSLQSTKLALSPVPIRTCFPVELPSPLALLMLPYIGGVAIQFGLIVWQLRRVSLLVSGSQPLTDSTLYTDAVRLARRMSLPESVIRIRLSDKIVAPLMVGLFRPTILLPSTDAQTLTTSEIRMILAHEFAHLRRGDLWLALLPALARALYFFYPPVWVACRRYEICREAVCDAEALRATDAPADVYGRLLLRLSSSPNHFNRQNPNVASLGVASEFRFLKGRVQMLQSMIQSSSVRRPVRAAISLGLIGLLILVPWKVVAGSQKDSSQNNKVTVTRRITASPIAPQRIAPVSPTTTPPIKPVQPQVSLPPTQTEISVAPTVPTIMPVVPSVVPLPTRITAPLKPTAPELPIAAPQTEGSAKQAVPAPPTAPEPAPPPPTKGTTHTDDDNLPIVVDIPKIEIPKIIVPQIVVPKMHIVLDSLPDIKELNQLVASASQLGTIELQEMGNSAKGASKSRYGYVLLTPQSQNDKHGGMRFYGWQGKGFFLLPNNVSKNEFWVKRNADGATFQITDSVTVQMLKDALQPIEDLGAKMGKVGGEMGVMGKEMGEIGTKMGTAGAKQGRLAQERVKLSMEVNRLNQELPNADDANRTKEKERISDLQSRLDAVQKDEKKVQDEMQSLQKEMMARQNSQMKDSMKSLGKQLRVFGQQMRTLQPQVFAKMDAITDAAIKDGRAKPIPPRSK